MSDAADLPQYCDVSLPVPLEQSFTYSLPVTLQRRVQPGCRVVVPFGARKLTGVTIRVHSKPPEAKTKAVLRLLDEQPVLDEEMMWLARWISEYYCAPLGEVLRGMTPLGTEQRHTTTYTLTDTGRDTIRQLTLTADEADVQVQILRLLEQRPLSSAHLKKKFDTAEQVIRALERRGFVQRENAVVDRDPMRAGAERLQVSFLQRPEATKGMKKAERELLSFLELHPGFHNVAQLQEKIDNASTAARQLARRQLVKLELEDTTRPVFGGQAAHHLNPHQAAAVESVSERIAGGEFHTFLLQGVTGSGKTEVYLNIIESALRQGRSALLLVPEIALTPAVAGQFFHRFGDHVAILHSAFHDSERTQQWKRIHTGEARVVVGTRSGVFAPMRDLGLIIVDEEHDASYKQGETPRYHGRDVAIVRAQSANAVVVLGSATPSLETKHNAERGKYTTLLLPERIQQRPMPVVELIDMRVEFVETRQQGTFSRAMLREVGERVEAGEQVMILLNRRGFSSFVACRSCGERVLCVNCSVTLTFHRRDRRLMCHYCNYVAPVPEVCPSCQSEKIQFLGLGSERVEDELHREYPTARIARMDRDTIGSKRHFEKILHGFRAHEYDILVGTQMIAKGHDIPNVTLVGVVSADIGLGVPDFHAAERTFQLLTQVAGRAGRGDRPGRVLVQTINPDHYAIHFAARQDYEGFYQREIEFRRAMRYPPFAALANVMVRDEEKENAMRMAGELERLLLPTPPEVKFLGPAEASVPRVRNQFRYQILLKSASRKALNQMLRHIRDYAEKQRWQSTALVIDVDPVTLL